VIYCWTSWPLRLFYIVNTHSEFLKAVSQLEKNYFSQNICFFPPKTGSFPIERNIYKQNLTYTCILVFWIGNCHIVSLWIFKGCFPIWNELFFPKYKLFPPKTGSFLIERNIYKQNLTYTCILVFWIGNCHIVSLLILTLEQLLYSGYTYTSCWFLYRSYHFEFFKF
jgi:hypothetical protein